MWDRAEDGARTEALEAADLEYDLNEGDGAFYGPKIDLHMTDSIGRSWQLGTVQLDYYDARAFELAYTGADNAEHRPVMIHRALLGSFERFIGILIEHYAGEFPLWLAPVQAVVLPIADRHVPYARSVAARARARRASACEVDDRTESVGQEDPRGRAAEGPVHARGGRQRGGRRARWPSGATARGTRAPSGRRLRRARCATRSSAAPEATLYSPRMKGTQFPRTGNR